MTEDMIKYDGDKKLIEAASVNVDAIKVARMAVATNMLELGRLFSENKDNSYFKHAGYESWAEFLGDPEIGFKDSTVRGFMQIHKKFIIEMEVEKPLLASIGFSKLRTIIPVVLDDPDRWLGQAETLSRSDLTFEVKEAQGKVPPGASPVPPKYTPSVETTNSPDPGSNLTYRQRVAQSPCCVCQAPPPSVNAHWPVTTGAGRSEVELWTIPLCRECHDEYHNKGELTFFSNYKHHIGRYFFHLVLPMFAGEPNGKDADLEGLQKSPDGKEPKEV